MLHNCVVFNMANEQCRIYKRYEATMKDGNIVKLRFQDLPSLRAKDVVAFTLTHTTRDEAFHKAAGINKSQDALEEYRELMYDMHEFDKPRVTICCVDDGTAGGGEIAGVSVIKMCETGNSEGDLAKLVGKFNTTELKALFSLLMITGELCSYEKRFKSYYEGRGVTVHTDYRGLEIANEFIKLRQSYCEEDNVDMTCAWMTAIGTQRAAEKNSWKVAFEITPEELGKLSGLKFDTTVPVFKYMYATND